MFVSVHHYRLAIAKLLNTRSLLPVSKPSLESLGANQSPLLCSKVGVGTVRSLQIGTSPFGRFLDFSHLLTDLRSDSRCTKHHLPLHD